MKASCTPVGWKDGLADDYKGYANGSWGGGGIGLCQGVVIEHGHANTCLLWRIG